MRWIDLDEAFILENFEDVMEKYNKLDAKIIKAFTDKKEVRIVWDKPVVKKIIYSYPKTIVLWGDGTKTIVSVSDADIWDEYSGFCAALAKKMYGSTSASKRIMEKYKTVQKPKKKIVKVPVDLFSPTSFADAINRTLDALKRRLSDV